MASPHVAGAAAAAWERYPSLLNTQVADLITQNNAAAPGYGLVRDDVCWPNDGSTFERLDLLHMIDENFFETGNKGAIFGFAFNAETGEPLAGAKVTAKQGATVTGTDYVPYYGALTAFYPDMMVTEGLRLFNVLADPGLSSVTFSKTGFVPPVVTDVNVEPDTWAYAGNIPIPPNKPYYWLVVAWDYAYPDAWYDSYLWVEDYDTYSYNNTGTLNAAPWVKHLWDSDDEFYWNLRAVSEVFRISKIVPGKEYYYYVYDWQNGGGSTSWNASGIKAYIFRWNAATAKLKLVTTFTPPPGSTGAWWDICSIVGNAITPINEVYDLLP